MEDEIDVLQTIRAARDSVWVIEDTIAKIDSGKTYTESLRDDIDRNVSHLKIVVNKDEVKASEEDISDLHAAIQAGEAKLAEYQA
jgi:hypothetical protein